MQMDQSWSAVGKDTRGKTTKLPLPKLSKKVERVKTKVKPKAKETKEVTKAKARARDSIISMQHRQASRYHVVTGMQVIASGVKIVGMDITR